MMTPGQMVTASVRLERLLGEGGMGAVWVAHHTGLGTDVAVKFISAVASRDRPAARERFEREARAAAQIKSPHVVHTYDHGVTDDGTPYIVMELLEGESLGERLRRGPLSPADASTMVSQAAKALGKAHELGIVHRDIKPDNLFLDASHDETFIKVLDFGIAKHTAETQAEAQSVTTTGALLGTPLYMSPELIKSAKAATAQADLWALAVVAYEMLTGVTPFEGETVGALFFAICGDPIEPPSSRRQGLPAGLDRWFERALNRDMSRRFSSASELARSFAEVVDGAPMTTVEVASDERPDRNDAVVATGEFVELHALDVHADTAEARPVAAGPPVAGGALQTIDELAVGGGSAASEEVAPTLEAAGRRNTAPAASGAPPTTLGGAAAPVIEAAASPPRSRWHVLLAAAALAGAGLGGALLFTTPEPSAPAIAAPEAQPPAVVPAPAAPTTEPSALPAPTVPFFVQCAGLPCTRVDVDGVRYPSDAYVQPDDEELAATGVENTLGLMLTPGPHRLRVQGAGMGERAVTTDVTVAADADALQLQRLELESEATGDIPRSVIQAIFESKRRDHQACYEQALRRNRAMIFRLNVRLVVGVGGEVAYLRTSYDGQLDDEAVQCVEQSIRPLRFPAPGDGPVIVSYPIHFSQSAPQKAKTPPTSSYGYPSGSLPVQSTSSPILQKKEPPRTKN